MQRILVPIRMPNMVVNALRAAKRLISPEEPQSPGLTLRGDRDVEWSFIASRIPAGSGRIFDFGCGDGQMSIHALQKGYEVLALDLEPAVFPWTHPNIRVISGDLLRTELPHAEFDFVMNCSTVEHVGLSGRYGVAVEETNGDLEAMRVLHCLLKPAGRMIMTIPCGQDAAIVPFHRVYGRKRLPQLLSGYVIEEELYWAKRDDNRWYPTDRDKALSCVPSTHPTLATRCVYALGCFVLRKGKYPEKEKC